MKALIKLLFLYAGLFTSGAYAQCPDVYDDVNNNTFVCGTYGDANGVSDWNWEIADKNDPDYCSMWYARTSSVSTKLTAMGSPFVDASTSALDQISQKLDFKKDKGWELLRRDFGCSHVTAYPYFVLYNKWTGLMRIYVYQPETQPQYSGILVQVEPTQNPWPATTALGDDEAITPDKFFSSNQAGNYGKMVVCVSEPGGSSRWSVAEFTPAFDPNIENSIYTGAGLKFTIFGVLTFDMKAKIKGRSVTSTDPKVYNFNYSPTNTPTTSGNQTFNFTAAGEKFIKLGKTISEIRNKAHTNATDIYNSMPGVNPFESSLEGTIKSWAGAIMLATQSDEGFGKAMETAAKLSKTTGGVLKFIGSVIGLFTGIDINKPAPMPSYTSYDLVLEGTITAKSVQQSFILRVPGTQQPNNDNGTYYKCPLGIVNLSNAPEAEVVEYERIIEKESRTISGYPLPHHITDITRGDFISLKMRNNLSVSYNDGAGLDLVSVQAAIVGEVLPDQNGNAQYDLMAKSFYTQRIFDPFEEHWYCNYLRPDLEAGRLEIVGFDPVKGLHVFQTPYVNLECVNGLAFNAPKETKVYLRLKAILKKKNDPDNTPIFYIRDYMIHTFPGTITPEQLDYYHTMFSARFALPPYCNYTETPTFVSTKTIDNITYNVAAVEKADFSIQTLNNVIVNSTSPVVFKSGHEIILNPGFEANTGADFSATIMDQQVNLNCTTPQIQAYQYSGDCYNTSITALRSRNTRPAKEESVAGPLTIYPTLSDGMINITGALAGAQIVVADASGRIVMVRRHTANNHRVQLNLSHLNNGVYFIRLNTPGKAITKKIILHK